MKCPDLGKPLVCCMHRFPGFVLLVACACSAPGDDTSSQSATDTSDTSDATSDGPTSETGETPGSPTTETTSTGESSAASDSDATSDATTGSSSDTEVDTDATDTQPDIPAECDGIEPSAEAQENYDRILACLTDHAIAKLAPGTFPLHKAIDMPDGSRLLGDQTWPTIELVADEQSILRTHDDNEVAFVRLDANDLLTVPHNGIIHLRGNNAFIHDNHIQNGDGAKGDNRVTGVRFWTPETTGNRVFRNQIHHLHYGVIFDLFPNGADNLLEQNKIFEIRCDAVTFRGYGRAHNNEIYRNGYQCLNPPEDPIPGGGFYTLENHAGAEIIGNHAYETCGMPLDLDRASNLVIEGNTFEDPGFVWDGHSHCAAGATAHLIDIRDSQIRDNTFRNNGLATMSGDPNKVMSPDQSGFPSDLPSTTNQAVALMLTNRPQNPGMTTGNAVEDNRMIATCQAPCVGLGYFLSRGTGYGADQSWSPETTNYFRRNDPFGSDIGSKRCGGNWYAADSTCEEGMLDPDCNIDDPQHNGQQNDWARNDGCNFYN